MRAGDRLGFRFHAVAIISIVVLFGVNVGVLAGHCGILHNVVYVSSVTADSSVDTKQCQTYRHIFRHMPDLFLLVHLIALRSATQSLITLASLASIGR